MNIVISDCDHASIDPELAVFAEAGLSAPAWLSCRTEDDLIAQCKGASGIINQYAPFTSRVFAALAPGLKQVVRYGVGVNNVDLDAATQYGVQVCNVPDYGMHEVSDHTLALMLALARKLVPMVCGTRGGEWDYQKSIPLFRLCGQTVGTVGLGRNGRLFAGKAAAFGCRVLAYDPYRKADAADDLMCVSVSFDQLVRESDFIAVNCPLTEETRHMFSDAEFEKMKSTAYIINASRGGIIDEAALAGALERKRIAGAALDVTEKEPLHARSPLRDCDACLITPHMAWYSEESAIELKRKAAEEAVRMAMGKKVLYPVNRL